MKNVFLKSEFLQRLQRFQLLLTQNEIDGAVIVQKTDLYYLVGSDQNGLLWVPADGQPLFLVRKSYERALQDAMAGRLVAFTTLSQAAKEIVGQERRNLSRIGLEMDVLPVNLYFSYSKLFPGAEMVDISRLIRSVRMVKSDREIALVRKAAVIADELFRKVPEFLKESETETDLALRAEAFYRSQGHPGISPMRAFNEHNVYGHIMAGASAALPSASPGPTGGPGAGPFLSHGAGRGKIKPREPVLFDYTSSVQGYISDQCRIYSLGDLPQKFHKAHRLMMDVQQAIATEGKPGTRAGYLYALALDLVKKAGLLSGFMGYPQPVPFVGHGIGLELDEWPLISKNSDHVLEKGMTIALEPKFVMPGEGVVGVENVFVVTDDGMEKLSQFPDDIVIVS